MFDLVLNISLGCTKSNYLYEWKHGITLLIALKIRYLDLVNTAEINIDWEFLIATQFYLKEIWKKKSFKSF